MKDISGSARNSSGGDASSEEPLRISKEMLEDAPENTPVDFERGMSYFTPLTLALITANILVFIWQLADGSDELVFLSISKALLPARSPHWFRDCHLGTLYHRGRISHPAGRQLRPPWGCYRRWGSLGIL